MSAIDDWCERCGVNQTMGGGLCRFCSVDDDFDACEFCHGTECTQECEDDDNTAPGTGAP